MSTHTQHPASLKDLRDSINAKEGVIKTLKEQIQEIEDLILKTHGPLFNAQMAALEKVSGKVSRTIDGVKVSYEIRESVTWDQEQLQQIVKDNPALLGDSIDQKLSVSKKTMASIEPVKLLDRLIDARTIKYSNPIITIE